MSIIIFVSRIKNKINRSKYELINKNSVYKWNTSAIIELVKWWIQNKLHTFNKPQFGVCITFGLMQMEPKISQNRESIDPTKIYTLYYVLTL